MRKWGLAWLGLLGLVFAAAYAASPLLSSVKRGFGGAKRRGEPSELDFDQQTPSNSAREAGGFFPERSEIATPPFFDTPFALMSGAHRAFLRLAVFAVLFVFAFWAVIYALDLSSDRGNPSTQVALMRSNLLFGGSPDRPKREAGEGLEAASATSSSSRQGLLATRVRELEQTRGEDDYQSDKKFKEQYKVIEAQHNDLIALRRATGQLEQTLPGQISDIGSRATVAEARAGEVMGQAEAVRQMAEGVQKQLGAKIGDVETRATRAAEQVGKVEDQASVLATRTEALEKELDRRARQIEARTEELGERTAGLKEREERVDRLQRIAFAAILGELKSNVDDLERRLGSSFYRFFGKGEAKRDADSLRQRIAGLSAELREMNTDQAKQFIAQLDELTKRLDQIAERIK